jgi:hypothetical protein
LIKKGNKMARRKLPARVPKMDKTGLEPSKWVRQRDSKLIYLVRRPLEDAREIAEPWHYINGEGWMFFSNPIWEEAVVEYNRRYNLYMQCIPVTYWNISELLVSP